MRKKKNLSGVLSTDRKVYRKGNFSAPRELDSFLVHIFESDQIYLKILKIYMSYFEKRKQRDSYTRGQFI